MMADMNGGIKGDTIEGIIPKDNIIGVFLSWKLIWYKLNAPSIDRYS